MYRFAICDDDKAFCGSFYEKLKKIFQERMIDHTLAIFQNTASFMKSLETGEEYDLVFLDILMNDENGIAFARSLRTKGIDFDIVFITTCDGYAVESFDVDPLYYLLKPVDETKLKAALERFLQKNTPGSIYFHTPKGYLNIKISNIIYIEICNHNLIVRQTDGTSNTFRGTLSEIESQLPPSTFLKPHRSYLVNFEHITGFFHGEIKATNNTVIPVSKRLYQKAQQDFIRYLDKSDVYI